MELPEYTDEEIVAARPEKADVDPWEPYAYHVEEERSAAGTVDDVATLFLTNRECPFRCLMCDLWTNTTDETVPEGAVPAQIDYALDRLPDARHVKLYNSGNFFDRKAFPPSDRPAIAERVQDFDTVIVENHPKLCRDVCVEFRDRLGGRLEIALGLETAHPTVLDRLNKRMTRDDFRRAVGFLRENDIDVRTFILLRPPFLSEDEGVVWALRSIEFAFDAGVQCVSVVPTRSGNGIMQQLEKDDHFEPPSMPSIETVLEEGLRMNRSRVFMDLWDLERFYECETCGPKRRERLRRMNLTQTVQPPVQCTCSDRQR
ncbi:radical SAM protein [Salinibacter sp. 10B]|uniref:radical SAM protein n=1 Tax=Salinibacter sp. 10B TaxID=1923971 RepID=UPI000CF425FC|nr:radical SAM protein [Salinibacter sp. 10B]PQJ35362.1 radical SAM protein [Salinibacter sp. 10B]